MLGIASIRTIRFYRISTGFSKPTSRPAGELWATGKAFGAVGLTAMPDGSVPASKAEHVADFHEELAAVVHESPGGVGHVAGREGSSLDHVEILEVAVVANIDRCAGMDEIGDQEVGVELLGGGQVGVGRANARRGREQPVVLQDEAQRQLRRELPIPLAAEDMVVEDAASGAGILGLEEGINRIGGAQALEQVRVLDFQRLHGANDERGPGVVFTCDERPRVGRSRDRGGGWGSDDVDGVSPVVVGLQRCELEVSGRERRSAGVFVIILVAERWGGAIERVAIETKILRTQPLPRLLIGTKENDGLASSLDGEIGGIVRVEAQPGVVEIVAGHQGWSPVHDPAMLGAEAIVNLLLGFANVDPVDESGDRNKAGGDVGVGAVVGQMQADALEFQSLGGSGVVIVVAVVARAERISVGLAVVRRIGRTGNVANDVAGRGDRLSVERPVGGEFQTGVNSAKAVELTGAGAFPVGVQNADARLAEKVAVDPRDGEVRANAGQRAGVGNGKTGTAIVGRDQADRIRAVFSGKANSGGGVADVAREEQVHRRAEKIFVLEEKLALLGKVDGVALVDRDQGIFRLHLAEVRVRRQVDDEMIVDDELGVHAGLALQGGMLKIGVRGIARVQGPKSAHEAVRNQLDIAVRRDAFQTVERCRLGEASFNLVGDVRPEDVLRVPRDATVENDSPILQLPGREAKAFEGNRDPDHKALLGNFAPRIPNGVERGVEMPLRFLVAGGFRPNGVPLNAQGGGLERVRPAAVVKGVENDLDLIVIVNVFAIRHACAHFAGIVEADKDDVQIFLVVAKVGLGGLGYWFTVVGVALRKTGNLGHLPGDLARRFHR